MTREKIGALLFRCKKERQMFVKVEHYEELLSAEELLSNLMGREVSYDEALAFVCK